MTSTPQNQPLISVALVEDDRILREELAHFLCSNGFLVHELNNGLSLNDLLLQETVDLIILDVNLPGDGGFDIARRIRAHSPSLGIMMLTARTGLPDRLKGYECGADIYLSKPTPPEELLAALMSLYRRLHAHRATTQWRINSKRRLLHLNPGAEPVALTAVETILLTAMVHAPNQTVESDALCDMLSQRESTLPVTKRALENLISRLRKKIADNLPDQQVASIQSVWGLGYQLVQPVTIDIDSR